MPKTKFIKENSKNIIIVALLIVAVYLIAWDNDMSLLTKNKSEQPQKNTAEILDANTLSKEVVPAEGYTVNVRWGDTGIKLVGAGAVDLSKFRKNYTPSQYKDLLSFLTEVKEEGITITRDNSYFWVNTLWALGLTQQSDVLTRGVMGSEYGGEVGNFASTGGWTLGKKDAVSLFSSSDIIPLTQEQQDLVTRVSGNIYRPCCGNPTSFPDCNHGMAILGLLELMASQGATEEEMYQASLAFNSYWFTTTYVDLAYYFKTEKGLSWDEVDPKEVLSEKFSSAQGYQAIKRQIGNIPGTNNTGASCGA